MRFSRTWRIRRGPTHPARTISPRGTWRSTGWPTRCSTSRTRARTSTVTSSSGSSVRSALASTVADPARTAGSSRQDRQRVPSASPASVRDAGAPTGELVAQPVDHPDTGSDGLVEELGVGCARVGPGGGELHRPLDLHPQLDERCRRDAGPELGELVALLVVGVVTQHRFHLPHLLEEGGLRGVEVLDPLHDVDELAV